MAPSDILHRTMIALGISRIIHLIKIRSFRSQRSQLVPQIANAEHAGGMAMVSYRM